MDEKEIQQQIALFYSKLPSDLQGMFSSMEWLENLKKISGKYGLNNEQIQTLGTETTLVLLGIIHTNEYERKIKEEIKLPASKLDKFLEEINNEIVKDFKTQLSETFNKNKEELEENNSEVKEDLDERFNKLPVKIKKIIIEINYHEELYNIARENSLPISEIGILEEVVTRIVNGNISPERLKREIKERLDLSEEKANKITEEVNAKILKLIREKMGETYNKKKPTIQDIKPEIKHEDKKILSNAGIELMNGVNHKEKEKPKADLSIPELPDGHVHNII